MKRSPYLEKLSKTARRLKGISKAIKNEIILLDPAKNKIAKPGPAEADDDAISLPGKM